MYTYGLYFSWFRYMKMHTTPIMNWSTQIILSATDIENNTVLVITSSSGLNLTAPLKMFVDWCTIYILTRKYNCLNLKIHMLEKSLYHHLKNIKLTGLLGVSLPCIFIPDSISTLSLSLLDDKFTPLIFFSFSKNIVVYLVQ